MARKIVKPESRVKIISAAASNTASKCYLGRRAGLNKVGGGGSVSWRDWRMRNPFPRGVGRAVLIRIGGKGRAGGHPPCTAHHGLKHG